MWRWLHFFFPAKDAAELTKVELQPILGETSWKATVPMAGTTNSILGIRTLLGPTAAG